MTLLVNKPYQLLLLLALSLLLSFCTGSRTKAPDAKTIHLYKNQLDSLSRSISGLEEYKDEDQARFYKEYLMAIQIIDLLPDSSELKLSALNNLLFPLYMYGAHQETIKQSEKIIEILNSGKKEFSHIPVWKVYFRLAIANFEIGNIDLATSIYRKIVFFELDDRDILQKASLLNNVGMRWKDFGEADSAMVYYQYAFEIVKEYPDSVEFVLFEGSILDNMATIFEDRGEFDKSIPIYEKNILRFENSGDLFRWVNARISLMNAELEMRNYSRVKILFDQLSPIMDTLRYPDHHTNNLYMIKVASRYYSETGDFRKAYACYSKESQFSDSIKQNTSFREGKTAKQLDWLQDKYFEQQLQAESFEREKEEQRSRSRLWIIILIAFGAIITPTLLYFFYKQRIRLHEEKVKSHHNNRLLAEEKLKTRNQEKQLLDLQLEHKKKDLVDMAVSISQKQAWATKLAQKVKLIESSKGHMRSREFKKLKIEILNQVYIDQELSLLNQNIDKLNKEFYDKLTSRFPDLSKTNIKLCSYFKLKLTNQQVARLQNIAPSSVKVSRYRLKKKLGLEPDQNLDAFLQSF